MRKKPVFLVRDLRVAWSRNAYQLLPIFATTQTFRSHVWPVPFTGGWKDRWKDLQKRRSTISHKHHSQPLAKQRVNPADFSTSMTHFWKNTIQLEASDCSYTFTRPLESKFEMK